jgi:hypothetical protein
VRGFVVSVVAGLALATMAGCGLMPTNAGESKQPQASAKPTEPAAPPYLAKPKVGECHDLTVKDIQAATETKKPVPCSERHTTVTVAVVDAPAGKTTGDDRTLQVGQACGPGYTKALGGDSKTRAKTLYSLAWFSPTKAQKAKGATWMRCDLALTALNRAYPISGDEPLLADGPTTKELACGRLSGSGAKATWIFVPCATKHQFVLNSMVAAGVDATYKDAEKAAKKACLLKGGLYSWSHADQWGIGDRWYICWESTEPIVQDPGVLALGPAHLTR